MCLLWPNTIGRQGESKDGLRVEKVYGELGIFSILFENVSYCCVEFLSVLHGYCEDLSSPISLCLMRNFDMFKGK